MVNQYILQYLPVFLLYLVRRMKIYIHYKALMGMQSEFCVCIYIYQNRKKNWNYERIS